MSIYVVTGKLGNGKTLMAVKRIRDYLLAGRRVATNLDLKLDKMLPSKMKSPRVVRIPDKPTADDFLALGNGYERADGKRVDENKYGLLVLDELGSWLNARDWSDKGRQRMIDWLIHARKHRWDVMFIVQSQTMLDKQVREALLEYLVTCKRLDKIKIPFFGHIGKALTFGAWDGCCGRIHLGVVLYAAGASILANALVVDRWLYRGVDLFDAYDTEQVFSSRYDCGAFSYLTPWHLVGRYEAPRYGWRDWAVWVGRLVGLLPAARRKRVPAARLAPICGLPAEARWRVARKLVLAGAL